MSDQQPHIETVQVECIEHRIAPNGAITLIIDSGIGFQVEIPAGLFIANHEPIPSVGTVRISSSMYGAWFDKMFFKAYDDLSDQLYQHFNGVMACRDIILSDRKLFRVGARFIQSGTSMTGGRQQAIGPLMIEWERGNTLKTDDGKSNIVSIGGSLGSGAHTCLLWNPEQGLFKDNRVKGWSEKLKYMWKLPSPEYDIINMRRLVNLAMKASG